MMKQKFLSFLKPFSTMPALFMLCIIFGFSAQTGETSGNLSYHISYEIVEFGNNLFDLEMDETDLSHYAHTNETPIRKLAHMAEYFLLTIFVLFPFYVYGLRGVRLFLTTGLLCVIFAGLDEFHQYFVSERSASVIDVGIDSIGIGCALLIAKIGGRISSNL